MKEVVILSGKGGTGKTSIAGCFAAIAKSKVLCDCDVDAADLYLLLRPENREDHKFYGGRKAYIDSDRCTRCGLCQEMCRFGAIRNLVVDASRCEGCGFCARLCPGEAVGIRENLSGHWFVSRTPYGFLVHARLGIGEENSGKLVTVVRNEARRIAEEGKLEFVVTDGPPGIGCPVISSLSGASAALIVTEPTLSGMHDMDRVLGVCEHFRVPPLVCINKFDVNSQNSAQIESMCYQKGIPVVGKIPYDNIVTEAVVKGVPVVEYSDGDVSGCIRAMWHSVSERMRASG